jgi:hypothetical protein
MTTKRRKKKSVHSQIFFFCFFFQKKRDTQHKYRRQNRHNTLSRERERDTSTNAGDIFTFFFSFFFFLLLLSSPSSSSVVVVVFNDGERFSFYRKNQTRFARVERRYRFDEFSGMSVYTVKRGRVGAVDETISRGSVDLYARFGRFRVLRLGGFVRHDQIGSEWWWFRRGEVPSAGVLHSVIFDANGDVVDIDVAFYVQFSGEETKRTRDERRYVLRVGYFPRFRGVVRLAVF